VGQNVHLPDGSRVEKTLEALRANGFAVWLAADRKAAEAVFWREIFYRLNPRVVSWGDSMTLHATDILPQLQRTADVELIETFGAHLTRPERMHNRKLALASDLFLTGTNAITTAGQLVNLDMVGNRVAGITFGPEHVVILVGTNKITEDLAAAMERIKTVAAPLNAKRHADFNTPCRLTGKCADCRSPQRICNTWTITEKSYPVGRIKIILINEALGL